MALDASASAPTPWSHAVFLAKVRAHQVRRALVDLAVGPPRCRPCDAAGYPALLGASRTPLISDRRPEERAYQLGKIENLRQAAARLDGLAVPAGGLFSFWRQVGPATAARGFVVGRMLQEGCLVPAVGGGLCQLSNAFFDTALQAGCQIVERHPHSRRVPGSAAAVGRDATVAWNYVDLRFRPRRAVRIAVSVDVNYLSVSLHGLDVDGPAGPATPLSEVAASSPAFAESCATCGDAGCFRHEDHGHA